MNIKEEYDQKTVDGIFHMAKSGGDWPIIISYAKCNRTAALWRSKKWSETLLHWAVLGNLSATIDLLSFGADCNCKDSTGRTPLAWAMEKAFFLATDPPKEMEIGRVGKELSNVETTIMHLINIGADIREKVGSVENGYDLMELACRGGLSNIAKSLIAAGVVLDEKCCVGLIEGAWLSEMIFEDVACQLNSVNISSSTPPGLIAAELYINGRIDEKRLISVNSALGVLDEISDDGKELSEICAKYAKGEEWLKK